MHAVEGNSLYRFLYYVWLIALLASPRNAVGGMDQAEPSSTCSQLFGDEEEREQNMEHRKKLLMSVRVGDYCIEVLHSADWEAPEEIEYIGLELIETIIDEESEPQALVQVSDEIDELECDPGTYIVEVDDSIGEEARILAILQDFVLIEENDELKFLKTEEAGSPVWRMIWKSSWKLLKTPDSSRKVRSPSRRRRKHTRPPRRGRRR
jgi:hypothetical protein